MIIIEWFTSTWQLTYRGALSACLTAIAWVMLSIFFYLGGCRNEADNERYIYSVIDWGKSPGSAAAYSVAVCGSVGLFHLGLVAAKNAIVKCWIDSRHETEKNLLIVTDPDGKTNSTEMV